MWKTIVGLALSLVASAASTQPAALQSPFHRGVNVLGYDPYWKDVTTRRFQTPWFQ